MSPYIANSVLDSAVALLLVETEKRRNAMTISCFSEVAHFPAAIWVSVAKSSFTHELLQQTRRFSLAVLTQKQKALAIRCASTSGRDSDKCKGLDFYRSEGGFLFLNDSLASTGLMIRESTAVGDHSLFVADIVESHFSAKASRYRHLLISDLNN